MKYLGAAAALGVGILTVGCAGEPARPEFVSADCQVLARMAAARDDYGDNGLLGGFIVGYQQGRDQRRFETACMQDGVSPAVMRQLVTQSELQRQRQAMQPHQPSQPRQYDLPPMAGQSLLVTPKRTLSCFSPPGLMTICN